MPPETLTPVQAREQLDTARREADEARTLADELADRVRDGDTEVTAEQLGAQRQLAELAKLRVEAAERKLQAASAADLDARAKDTAKRVRALVADDSAEPLVDAARAVMDAVHDLVSVAAEREAAIREVAVDGQNMNDALGANTADPWPSRRYGFLAQSSPPVNVTAVGEGRAVAVPVGDLLGAVVSAALLGRSDARNTAARIMVGIPESIARVTAGVPGLADALRITPERWQTLNQQARYEATQQGRRPLPQDTEG